jgi:hypothetical protein
MNLTIELPDQDVQVLKAKATACGVSAEQYALEVLEQDLAATETRPAPRQFDNLSDLLLGSPFAGANLNIDPKTSRSRSILNELLIDTNG